MHDKGKAVDLLKKEKRKGKEEEKRM